MLASFKIELIKNIQHTIKIQNKNIDFEFFIT